MYQADRYDNATSITRFRHSCTPLFVHYICVCNTCWRLCYGEAESMCPVIVPQLEPRGLPDLLQEGHDTPCLSRAFNYYGCSTQPASWRFLAMIECFIVHASRYVIWWDDEASTPNRAFTICRCNRLIRLGRLRYLHTPSQHLCVQYTSPSMHTTLLQRLGISRLICKHDFAE